MKGNLGLLITELYDQFNKEYKKSNFDLLQLPKPIILSVPINKNDKIRIYNN